MNIVVYNLTLGAGLATSGTFNLITSSCLNISPSLYSWGTSKRGEAKKYMKESQIIERESECYDSGMIHNCLTIDTFNH